MSFTTRPELLGTFGMATSTHWLASATAMAVLEKGGNAFDASVAAGLVLQIVEPHLNGPGGEVPIIFYSAPQDRVRVLCGQGVTPATMDYATLSALGLDVVPGTGLLPAVVPGAFGAWMTLLRDYGQLPLEEVMSFAIDYAENGYPVVPRMTASIMAISEFFKTQWPTSADEWLINGNAPKPNSRFANPAIANTYKRILTEAKRVSDRSQQCEVAREVFYKGFVAEAVDEYFQNNEVLDTSGRRNKGLLTGDDLANWVATYEDSSSYNYHGYDVHKTGPWGQGPVFLQQLALLKEIDLAALHPESPEFIHAVIECSKLAFADREVFYGDPNFTDIPINHLLSDSYNTARRALIDMNCASREFRPGDLLDSAQRTEILLRNVGRQQPGGAGQGEPTFADLPELRGDTVHLSVADRWGNVVSATPSGGWLQASPSVPGLGFNITTRAQMFWLEQGLPSSIGAKRRPRTTLTPTLVMKEGRPYCAFGSPGGDQQDQWTLQMFLKHVHHGMNLQEAIDAPTFQTAHLINSFYPRNLTLGKITVESRFPELTLTSLQEKGHDVSVSGAWSLGRVCAIGMRGGFLRGAATPRQMQAYAAGR